jgi:pimeloyl-ACP methyl ester carboxylesterase
MTYTSPGDGVTVAMVHGAFADSSGWSGVVERLHNAGINTTCIPNPLRGITEDAEYVASALKQIREPVLAVGHSYGGAVITNAVPQVDNVVGLVYVAAFAPDEGETLLSIEGKSRDSVLTSALVTHTYPSSKGTEQEFVIDPAKFHDAFAADVSAEDAAVMAATQRPISALAFSEPCGPPAWRSLPAWSVVATGDKAAGSDVVRSMAERAGATITEEDGSHAIMVSKPQVVADVIMNAVAAAGR